MDFNCKIRLTRLAALAAAQGLWQKKGVKIKIRNILMNVDPSSKYDEWRCLINEMIQFTPSLSLPNNLENLLMQTIKDTGLRIYSWYMYLKEFKLFETFTHNNYERYLEKVYWTVRGTIDEIRILKLFWCKDENISENAFKLFLMACEFCCTDVIDTLWEILPESVQWSDHSNFFNGRGIVFAYWIYEKRSCINEFMMNLKNYRTETIDENLSPEEFVLVDCAEKENSHLAVKYFWQKLNFKKKTNVISIFVNQVNLTKVVNMELLICEPNRNHILKILYTIDSYVEWLMFLLNNMTEDLKKGVNLSDYKLFINALYIFAMVLTCASPWQDILVTVFKQMQEFLENDEVVGIFLYSEYVLNTALCDFNISLDNTILNPQLLLLWKCLGKKFKLPTAKRLMNPVLKVCNEKKLKLIFNDEELAENRGKLLAIIIKTVVYICKDEKLVQLRGVLEQSDVEDIVENYILRPLKISNLPLHVKDCIHDDVNVLRTSLEAMTAD